RHADRRRGSPPTSSAFPDRDDWWVRRAAAGWAFATAAWLKQSASAIRRRTLRFRAASPAWRCRDRLVQYRLELPKHIHRARETAIPECGIDWQLVRTRLLRDLARTSGP